jgi:two-component system, NtrC family, sensor kinase
MVLSIVSAIVCLGAIAYWDESREAKSALEDFAREQTTLAQGLAAAIAARVATAQTSTPGTGELRDAFAPVSEPETLALLAGPGQTDFLASTGARVSLPALETEADPACLYDASTPASSASRASCFRMLSREEARSLGLPERRAMAGLSGFLDREGRPFRVLVVATARRERDRERRAVARLVLGFLLSSSLVLAFGSYALKKQQKEHALSRELAVEEAVRAQDERLAGANRIATLGALAIGIAHEVSTPLGVILGRAEQLASRVEGDERATRAVRAISEQAERIGSIVRSLLILARGGSPSLERVAPKGLAAAAVDLVEHRFRRAGVLIRMTCESDLPEVACDPRLFEQALVNLFLNACDACEAGGQVDVHVERAGDEVAFVVTDDGAGIGEDAAVRATEPFFTTKPEGKGSGLGLAIANEIVHHHRGKFAIAARSERRGTEARIELPAALPQSHAL